MSVDELEQTSAIKILLFLYRTKEQTKMSDLVKGVKASQNAIYKAVPKLNALGLINDKVTSYPLKRIFSLTEKGREVAEHLQEIEKILERGPMKLRATFEIDGEKREQLRKEGKILRFRDYGEKEGKDGRPE